jgi:hypothetical protein
MIVYQLLAYGIHENGLPAARYSYEVYTNKDAASAAIPQFKERICRKDHWRLAHLAEVEKVMVIELECIAARLSEIESEATAENGEIRDI